MSQLLRIPYIMSFKLLLFGTPSFLVVVGPDCTVVGAMPGNPPGGSYLVRLGPREEGSSDEL